MRKTTIEACVAQEMGRLGMDHFAGAMERQMAVRRAVSRDPRSERILTDLVTAVVDPGKAAERMRTHLSRQAEDGLLGDVAAWRASPLGRRLQQAEKEATDPAMSGEIARYVSSLSKSLPSDERIAVVQGVVRASGSVEAATGLGMAVVRAMAFGTAQLQGRGADAGDAIAAEVDKRRAGVEENVRAQTTRGAYYVYRDFSNDELRQYKSFLESASGVRYTALVNEALEAYFSEALMNIGELATEMIRRAARPGQAGP